MMRSIQLITLLLITLVLPGTSCAKSSLLEVAELSKIPDFAGDFDEKGWSYRAPVPILQSGLKNLEIPLSVLAHTDPSFKDLRLVSEGRQVPYLFEPLDDLRSVLPKMQLELNQGKAQKSEWLLTLPYKNLPLSSFHCEIGEVFIKASSINKVYIFVESLG